MEVGQACDPHCTGLVHLVVKPFVAIILVACISEHGVHGIGLSKWKMALGKHFS